MRDIRDVDSGAGGCGIAKGLDRCSGYDVLYAAGQDRYAGRRLDVRRFALSDSDVNFHPGAAQPYLLAPTYHHT